ncbi:hypothetical protein AgCh_023917 [Apium graveolens]
MLGGSKGKKKKMVIIASLIFSIGALMLGLSLIIYMLKKKKKKQEGRLALDTEQYQSMESQLEDLELPLIDLLTIEKATNYFSMNNILGEGGFGPVYKGILEDGRVVAVKRLLKTSRQGTDEFKNEVVCIAKLQHRNLVKLLGCCIQEEEMMLIYEYLPNKSLDFFIFVVIFRGNGASVAQIVPYAALHYMAYEQYRRWIAYNFPEIEGGPVLDLVAGSFFGGTVVLFTYPLDLVRTKLAYQDSQGSLLENLEALAD